MSDPFVSQILISGISLPPKSYAKCDGQSMLISSFPTLYACLGTAYGGSGVTDFNLPDLRGRTPISNGSSFEISYARGQIGGVENVTLSLNELAAHTHTVVSDYTPANKVGPKTDRLLAESSINLYAAPTNLVPLSSQSVTYFGGGGSHNNVQPFIVLNFCIALTGVFPPRS